MCQAPKFADITVISLGGRPSTYSEAITTTICRRIGQGKSLRQVCLTPDIPSKATVMRWLASPTHEEFRQKYRLACWLREQTLMDEILEITDDTSNDTIYGPSGKARPNMNAIRRAALRIKVRIWLISVWEPKKYGELILG